MDLIRMHAEVTVSYRTYSHGIWSKEGPVTGIDDIGIMIRESGTEYFIPWTSVIHVTLS